ncbi:MAG: hypothetical protein DIU78_022600 [Pseudomonadota bacterium]
MGGAALRAAIARFFEGRFCETLRTAVFRVRAIEASGQDALAFYRKADDGRAHFFAIQLVTARDGKIDTIDHVLSRSALGPFLREGLP